MRIALILVLLCRASAEGIAQPPVALDVNGKLGYHAQDSLGLAAMGYSGMKAGFLQLTDSPSEWGQGARGYGRRFGSAVATSGIRGFLAFGLDSSLHQDPRYYRSANTGFRSRVFHALRGTILTRKDNGGETLAVWRLGSAYGASFISNQWQPYRFRTARHGFADGSAQLGFDFANNLAAEFWPDIRRKISRRRR